MARVRIDLPETFLFETRIPIQIRDINYGNHLGHDAVLSIAHEARIRFFRHHGVTELGVGGTRIVIADVAAVYKSEGYHGDVLRVSVTASDPNKYGFDLIYHIVKADSGQEVARVKTGIVFLDIETRRPTKIPQAFQPCLPGGGDGISIPSATA